MSIGLSVELLIWIIALVVFFLVVIIWGLYRLFSYFRRRIDDESSSRRRYETTHTKATPFKFLSPILNKTNNSSNNLIGPRVNKEPVVIDINSDDSDTTGIEHLGKAPPGAKQVQAISKYINYTKQDSDSKSNDKILLYEAATKSLASAQSNKLVEMRSNQSRKSTGFKPTLRPVEPVIRGSRGSNFLEILDQLDNLDELELEDRKEKERRKKKLEERTYTASSAEIEEESSDETSSQTFIGKEPDSRPEPGRIKLGFIKAIDSDTSSDYN